MKKSWQYRKKAGHGRSNELVSALITRCEHRGWASCHSGSCASASEFRTNNFNCDRSHSSFTS